MRLRTHVRCTDVVFMIGWLDLHDDSLAGVTIGASTDKCRLRRHVRYGLRQSRTCLPPFFPIILYANRSSRRLAGRGFDGGSGIASVGGDEQTLSAWNEIESTIMPAQAECAYLTLLKAAISVRAGQSLNLVCKQKRPPSCWKAAHVFGERSVSEWVDWLRVNGAR